MTGPSGYFLENRARRAMRVVPSDWEDLKRRYRNCCGVCNRKRTTLEKGHKDPLSGDDLANLIPLCGKCNNWAGKDVVLDANGRVKALASEKLVMKSSLNVQKKIFDDLSKKFKPPRRTGRPNEGG